MVQYILTPWRDRQELLLVREQFYSASTCTDRDQQQQQQQSSETNTIAQGRTPVTARVYRVSSSDDLQHGARSDACAASTHAPRPNQHEQDTSDSGATGTTRDSAKIQWSKQQRQRQAVARVSMWMQRGNCPHMVESTALLTAAMLSDDGLAGGVYAVRAAYSAAFSRFVTGLLDGHQDKQRKQSMYAIAKTIGLPATFVELRHQATHEQLPSLAKLRSAAKKALDWIWNYYWKHLVGESAVPRSDPCRDIVLGYLRGDDEGQTTRALGQFAKAKVLQVIADVQATLPGNQVYLRCLKLSREVMMRDDKELLNKDENEAGEAEEVDKEEDDGNGAEKAAAGSGWGLYQGPWKPKPIGMV